MKRDTNGRQLSLMQFDLAVSRDAYLRGEEYHLEGRVRGLREELDEQTGIPSLFATVRGNGWEDHEVQVFLLKDMVTGAIEVTGECTCPVGMDCKHVAAVFFEYLGFAPERSGRPPGTATGRTAVSARPAKPQHEPGREALSPQLTAWLESLTQYEAGDSDDYPATVRQRMIYVLDFDYRGATTARLAVQPLSVRLLKDGSFSTTYNEYEPQAAFNPNPAKFLRPSDRAIMKHLLRCFRSPYHDSRARKGLLLDGEDGVTTLEQIIATGRARWKSLNGPVVTRGEPVPASVTWQLGSDAAQHAAIEFETPGLLPVVLAPPWYIDEASGSMGPTETGLGPRVAAAILSAPPVPMAQTQTFREALDARVPTLKAHAPPSLPPPVVTKGPPRPRLTLTVLTRASHFSWMRTPVPDKAVAFLSFDYDGVEVKAHDRRELVTGVRNGRVLEVIRDRPFEHQAAAVPPAEGFIPLDTHHLYEGADAHHALEIPDRPKGRGWMNFLVFGVPALREEGWEVVVDPSFPFNIVRADGAVDATLREDEAAGPAIDWLELDLGVFVDGERVDLVAPLLALIADPAFDPSSLHVQPGEADAMITLDLQDGRILAIPSERVLGFATALYELFSAGLFGAQDSKVRFSRFDAAELARLEAATADSGVAWTGGEALRSLGEMLRNSGGIPRAQIPASFQATLRPYQASGVDWLQFLRTAGLGGVLADDMGLGKTVQTLAHIAIEKEAGRLTNPALIVAPTSVISNWRQEAERFASELKVTVLQGPTRQERFGEIEGSDIVISTYPLLPRDRDVLSGREWHLLVLDEAQAIKNPDANAAKVARELKAGQRLCLTGTPVENHLGELWSLFSFIAPGFLGDRRSFAHKWRRPIEEEGNEERRRQLARRIKPFLIRRTKEDVASELPAKTEIIERVEMEAAQRDVYESIRLAMHERVRAAIAEKGLARSQIVLLDALLKMRQVCCDPRLLKLNSAKAAKVKSAKFERLMEMLPGLIEDGRRIILFSQFTSMLALIQDALKEAKIPYVLLTGNTRDRETPIASFQSGAVPLFLISLKAGGVGLNLTAADTVIHYDPWWNPAVEEQATDRAHRIGQDKPVFVYRLVTVASIEEKMDALKDRKREIAAGIFEENAGSSLELTESDIDELFAST